MSKQVITISKKGALGVLFVINPKDGREVSDDKIISAVSSFFVPIYGEVDVSFIKDIGHFTDIKVSGEGVDMILSWSFVRSVDV
ncbi:hypothetical protein [Phaeodactylibacter xiamenensis]|uniref:hypothetical protein n=1 Tax=Phaeodactylibacter xiamenensis TaxID=1524460 RepID=UPI0024A82E32|nr:hypothetical protein [Phaeodactylibacter xiamenensis]